MKNNPDPLPTCQFAMNTIAQLMEGKVVNARLSQPLELVDGRSDPVQFHQRYIKFIQHISLANDLRSRYWPVVIMPLFMFILFGEKNNLQYNFKLACMGLFYAGLMTFFSDNVAGDSLASAVIISFLERSSPYSAVNFS